MTELTERSGGLWRPSPGSVYPVLAQLEDEGLVAVQESAGRRVFSLTDAGRTYVASSTVRNCTSRGRWPIVLPPNGSGR